MGGAGVPPPKQAFVTRWGADPFARGGYSFYAVGNARSIVGARCTACFVLACFVLLSLHSRLRLRWGVGGGRPSPSSGGGRTPAAAHTTRKRARRAAPDDLAAPVGRLLFAGEATSRSPATAHGAYESGLREAARVLALRGAGGAGAGAGAGAGPAAGAGAPAAAVGPAAPAPAPAVSG